MSQSSQLYPNFDLARYFNVKSCAEVPWGHAINARDKLAAALTADIMLEADICVSDSDPSRIIMSHPPVRESDITFIEWCALVLEHCEKHPSQKVGMKLDFKDPPAVAPCLEHLASLFDQGVLKLPLWINADILTGAEAKKPPFDADEFLATVQHLLPGVVVSIGWTTVVDHPYTMAHCEEMLSFCKKHALKNATFPMRASLCVASKEVLTALLAADPTYTLTIWAGKEYTAPSDIALLRAEFDNSRIYMDVGGF